MKKSIVFQRVHDASIRGKFILAASLLLAALLVSGIYIGASSYRGLYEEHIETAKSDFLNCYQDMEKFEKRMYHLADLVLADQDTLELLAKIRYAAPNEYQQVKQELCRCCIPCRMVLTTIFAGFMWIPPWTSSTPPRGFYPSIPSERRRGL